MSAISKIQASLASATQETTLALANLNFDFSLIKVEPPASFHPLGAALSVQRRSAAENGMPHVIARRLGSLFETLLPQTPNLITAYGSRASEISKNLGKKASHKTAHGPFEKFIGLDGTSVWAAATSGPSAVATHLLACMLARAWSSAEAVSIWEELVAERKKVLVPATDVDTIPTRDVVAAQLSITKDQLAEWDASARAWLRAADTSDVTKTQQKELMDLLSSITIPVGSRSNVYESVCQAWVTALSTIDKLILGLSYSAQDGAVLVALTSWHLYPDVIVLGPSSRTLSPGDPLIAGGAALTLGLQSSDPETSRGVQWSLSLAHLRYYGAPVMASTTVGSSSSRLTFPQFLQVCLGALIANWGLSVTRINDAARLVMLMNSALSDAQTKRREPALYWLSPFAATATIFHTAVDPDRNAMSKLVKLGYRRRQMLSRTVAHPVFDLLSLDFSCVLNGIDHQIKFFRTIFAKWTRSDVMLVLRVLVHPSSAGQVRSDYTYCVLSGNQKHVREGTDEPLRQFQPNGDITVSQTGGRLMWSNPPDMLSCNDSPPPVAPFETDSREKSRWTFKTRKTAGTIKPPEAPRMATLDFVCGSMEGVSLYCSEGRVSNVRQYGDSQLDLSHLVASFANGNIDTLRLSQHLAIVSNAADSQLIRSCSAIANAARLYERMPGATISPKTLEIDKTFCELSWASSVSQISKRGADAGLSRAEAFSCVAFFESGIIESPRPDLLEDTMAISSADSLYVAAPLICDPARNFESYEIYQVMGNIGRAGLAFLIPPQAPMARAAESESWKLVNHDIFDGKLEDNFRSTTLHLSFTGYEIPMALNHHGGRFTEAIFIEAVVSVHDSGHWVADLDVLATLKSSNLFSLIRQPSCEQSSPAGSIPDVDFVSLDNWEELLDPPTLPSVVRAHGNWQARLAAASVSVMKGHTTILFRDHGCWTCAVKFLEQLDDDSAPDEDQVSLAENEVPSAAVIRKACIFVL